MCNRGCHHSTRKDPVHKRSFSHNEVWWGLSCLWVFHVYANIVFVHGLVIVAVTILVPLSVHRTLCSGHKWLSLRNESRDQLCTKTTDSMPWWGGQCWLSSIWVVHVCAKDCFHARTCFSVCHCSGNHLCQQIIVFTATMCNHVCNPTWNLACYMKQHSHTTRCTLTVQLVGKLA